MAFFTSSPIPTETTTLGPSPGIRAQAPQRHRLYADTAGDASVVSRAPYNQLAKLAMPVRSR